MTKTMLTCNTLDHFERVVDIKTLTEEQIKEVEHYAYCANMCAKDKTEAWSLFCHLINKNIGINIK